jgi:hypothetical protein
MRIATITAGIVTNVILGDNTLTAVQLGCDSLVQLQPGQGVSPGDLYDGTNFTPGPVDPLLTNQNTMRANAQVAYVGLRAYVALGSPTAAQTNTAVKLLCQVDILLIRFLLGQFDATN